MKRRNKMYSYEELFRVARAYYKDNGFCTVVAMTHASLVGFGKAFNIMKRYGRKTGQGTFKEIWNNKKMHEELGFTATLLAGTDSDYRHLHHEDLGTVCQVVKGLGEGSFWLLVKGHIIHVEDGKVMAWVKSNSRKRVQGVLQINRHFEYNLTK